MLKKKKQHLQPKDVGFGRLVAVGLLAKSAEHHLEKTTEIRSVQD